MNLKKQLASYTGINVLNSAIPFILLPILTYYLTPSDYGILSLIQMVLTLIFPLVLLNSQSLIVIEKSKLPNELHKKLFSTILSISLFTFIFLELVFIIFNAQISSYLEVPQYIVLFVPLILLFQVLPITLPLYFQSNKSPVNFGKVKVTLSLLNMTISIIFVVGLSLGWEGRLAGIALAYILTSLGCIYYMLINNIISFSINRKDIAEVISFGLPLLPHTIAGILLSMSDRFLISAFLDKSALGIYSVGFQIGMAVSILMTSINQAWAPNMYQELSQKAHDINRYKLVKQMYRLFGLMCLIVLLFNALIPLIYKLAISPVFSQSSIFAHLISVAFLFQGGYFLMTNFLFYQKKSVSLSINTNIALVISVCINLILIPKYGLIGASTTILITYLYLFISTWYLSARLYKMPWLLSGDEKC